jgi:hypothetical protein
MRSHKPTPEPDREKEYRAEAGRLALLPAEDRRAILALHRSVADNPKVPKRDRDAARARSEALARHLRRLSRGKKK